MLKEGFEPIPGYRLLNFLGRGQFGEVWRATSPGGTYIALKFLNVRERQGRKEFRAIQKVKGIRYPHLVQTYALWLLDENLQVIDDAAFDSSHPIMIDSVRATMIRQPVLEGKSHKPSMLVIATVLCEQNLMERLSECKKKGEQGIPPDELLGYIEDAAKAIDFLNAPRHELGEGLVAIHHCDIKPENIMILGDLAVVGDFGVARILGSGADTRATTTMGGSVAYAAPETFDNRTAATSDQYSLAITYFELRTGKLPFAEESQSQVMKDKLSGNLDLSEIPPSEAKVLRRALSVDPLKRFQSARSFVEALQGAVSGNKSEKRSMGWSTLAASITAISVVAILALIAFRPDLVSGEKPLKSDLAKEETAKEEVPKVDGASLFAAALQELRRSDISAMPIAAALEKSVRAIKQGGYLPTVCKATGMELTPIFQTNSDSLDENHCLKLVALSPDKKTIVKAVHHRLHFTSLQSDQSIQIDLPETEAIAQLAWLQDEIVMLDKSNRLTRVNAAGGFQKPDAWDMRPSSIPTDGLKTNNWLGMGQSGDSKKLFLLEGSESQSVGTFKVPPSAFRICTYSPASSAVLLNLPIVLNWKDRTPSIFVDHEGVFCLTGANYDGEIGTLTVWNTMQEKGIALAGTPAIAGLQEVTKVVWVDTMGSFLMSGISKDSEEDCRLVSGSWKDGKMLWSTLRLPNALPIGAILVDSSDSVLVAQSTKLLRCSRIPAVGDSNAWETKELFDFEDGLMPDGNAQTGATGKINAICKLNDRWLMTGHETGKAMMLNQGSGEPLIGFEMASKLDCSIQDIQVANGKVVLVGQDGRLLWFDLAEIVLTAESCKKAGIVPTRLSSTSVRS